MSDFLDTLMNNVINKQLDYPFPISYCLKRYWDLSEKRNSEKVDALLKLFEVNTKLLASIATKHILIRGSYNDAFRQRLSNFHRPSLGHWIELLRNSIKGINAVSEKDDLASNFTKWANTSINNNMELVKSYQKMCKISSINVDKGKLTPLRIIDIICTFRNKVIAHGSRVSDSEYANINSVLKNLVFHLIYCSIFLCEYDFCYVNEVKVKRGETFLSMRKSAGREFITDLIKSKVSLHDNRLYLMQRDKNTLKFVLDLSPFMVFSNCNECKTEQIFFYNSTGKNREFLSYQCGHHLLYNNPEDDLTQIEKFLRGEIPLSLLYQGKTLNPNFENIVFEDFKQNKKKVEEILSIVREQHTKNLYNQSLDLLQKAIELYCDSHEAYYLKAITLLKIKPDDKEILNSIQVACRLSPDNSDYSFLAMLICMAQNNYEKSLEFASKTYSQNPEDSKYKEINKAFLEKRDIKEITKILNMRSLESASILNIISKKTMQSKIDLKMWLVALFPWCLIKKRPFEGALIICLSYFGIIIFTSINELNTKLIIGIANIAVFIFLGLFAPFIIPEFIRSLYKKLIPAVNLDEDVFHRWFYTNITPVIGSYHYVIKSTKYKLKHVFKHDKINLLLYVTALIAFIPIQIMCASGLDPFIFEISSIIRYSFYMFQILVGIWIVPFIINSLIVIPIFGKMPIRYFLDMPDAMSLKSVGSYYLKVATLGTCAFVLFTIQHYLFQTHIYTKLISIVFIITISMFFFAIMFASQILIKTTLAKMRDKKLIQFSEYLESSFDELFNEPSEANLIRLTRYRKFVKTIKSGMPISGLTIHNKIIFILLSFLQISLLIMYFYLVINNIWFI